MTDAIDGFRALKDYRKLLRAKFGVSCSVCKVKLPRGNATILLPQQRCRQHKPNYRDPRPELTQEDIDTL